MSQSIRKPAGAHELAPVSLGELIHQHVRIAIETTVHEELLAALGATPYERSEVRRGYRNGTKERTLTGPSGPVALTLPRAAMFRPAGATEWTSTILPTILPRYQRRLREVNEAVAATYLAGGNTRRVRGALRPLLKAAPLPNSAVSSSPTTTPTRGSASTALAPTASGIAPRATGAITSTSRRPWIRRFLPPPRTRAPRRRRRRGGPRGRHG